ncbi:MAG: rubredoxin-like domain-containing protein [Clostridiaceae bacterium]
MKNTYRCVICGYIYVETNPPEICPICGASSSEFELLRETEKAGFDASDLSEENMVNTEKIRVLIIGSGIAGISAAEEIRKLSKEAEITIVSAEKTFHIIV